MRAYRALLSHREARWPLLTSTFSRLTPGMIVLAVVLAMREGGYAYAAAGAVSAAHQVGVGMASPVQGALVDRFGQPRVLVPDAIAYLAGTCLLAWSIVSGVSVPMLVATAAVTGMAYPPTTACSRVLLSGLFPSGQLRETAFALSAVAVEIGFIAGPLAAVAIAGSAGASWSVIVAGAAACVGAMGYAATAAARRVPSRDVSVARRGALRSPGVRVMTVALGAVAVAFGVMDIVIPAVAELAGDRSAAGWLIASIASGSLVGGLLYGGRPWPGTVVDRLRVLSSVFAVGLVLVPLAIGSLPAFALALFLGGLCLGPTTICAFQLIDDLALPGTQTEAQSWTQASVVAGVALGASLSGIAVDTSGPASAFVVGAVCVGAGAVLINLRRRRLVAPAHGYALPRAGTTGAGA